MQIMIEIKDTAYEGILNADKASGNWGKDLLGILCSAIAHGTTLPKGHGRLIDADKLEPRDISPESWYSPMWGFELDDIEDAPTIIGADKAESEKKCE